MRSPVIVMYGLEGKNFFDNIRRTVKISHFIASIIPLALLVYFSIKYVYPSVENSNASQVPFSIAIMLVLAVALSVLGLILMTRSTNSSIKSAQHLNSKINSLFDITKQFRETLYLDVLLKQIMKSALELNSAESGSLLLYDEEGQLRYKVNSGNNSEKMNDKIVHSGEGIAAMVADSGKPALINEAASNAGYDQSFDKETGFKTRSLMCVPLIHSNEIIGVIEVRNKKEGNFTQEDQALLHNLADQASISITQNRTNEKRHSDFINITEILVGAQDYVQHKRGHARRVAGYANLIGKQLNLSEKVLKKLYHASLLHDVGMLKLDTDDISNREVFIHHPKLGFELVKSVSMWNESADIILHHHERYDGTGYPAAKKADEIPLEARILSVADTFDVLTSSDSYRQQLDLKKAIEEIEANSGTQFDPEIVEALKLSIEEAGLE